MGDGNEIARYSPVMTTPGGVATLTVFTITMQRNAGPRLKCTKTDPVIGILADHVFATSCDRGRDLYCVFEFQKGSSVSSSVVRGHLRYRCSSIAIHLEVFFFFFLVVATFAAILVRSFNETKLRVDDSSELFWNGEYSKVCVYTYFLEI